MARTLLAPGLTIALLCWAVPLPSPAIASLQDAGALFTAGQEFLEALRQGTRVDITAPDGARTIFEVRAGALHPVDYRCTIEEKALRTPGGYRLSVEWSAHRNRSSLRVDSPTGAATWFSFDRYHTWGTERDGGIWRVVGEVVLVYLPDGTRIDLDRTVNVVQVTVGDHAWRMSRTGFIPTDEPSPGLDVPSPRVLYQTGDGDDWSWITDASLVAAGWEGMPGPTPLAEIIASLKQAPRKEWLERALAHLYTDVGGSEVAGYMLAAFFTLPPGTRIEMVRKKQSLGSTFILPGTLEVPRQAIMSVDTPP